MSEVDVGREAVSMPVATRQSDRRLSPRFLLFVIVMLIAAGYRVWTLVSGPARPTDLTAIRRGAAHWLASTSPLPVDPDGSIAAADLDSTLVDLGVLRIEVQHFDPQARVVIRPGEDGQPGVAGVDDNGDAVVDNRTELGATQSDDVCLVVPADDPTLTERNTLVLQRGAFLPTTDPARNGKTEQRAIVHGKSDQERWSFIVTLD